MIRKNLAAFLGCFILMGFLSVAMAQQGQGPAQGTQGSQAVPKDERKQTSLGKYAAAMEAYLMVRANPEKTVLLDVRTPEEYSFVGHAPMGVNIPSQLWTGKFDPEKKDYPLADNPDFEELVKARFKPDDTILVICRSGHRGVAAVNRLAKVGFTNVYNVVDGFEGDKVSEEESYYKGKRMRNGWKNAGLPWTTDLDPRLVYVPAAK
jgi:rhodanese-related sulfurtransferase